MIDFITLLQSQKIPIELTSLKIHLAGYNGKEHPFDKYVTGRFDEWQAQQSQKNFDCKQVIGLIDYSREGAPHHWLFAGLYTVHGSKPKPNDEKGVIYQMEMIPGLDELVGRIIIHYQRSGRNSYIWYKETQSYTVQEIRPKPIGLASFPGYRNIIIMHRDLQTIMNKVPKDWHTALTHMNGIYVITDTLTGNQYVGQATGSAGIWHRWKNYAHTGHGGNVHLKQLIQTHGPTYAEHFQYAILETMEMHATTEEIHAREQHWMRVLRTHQHGLN